MEKETEVTNNQLALPTTNLLFPLEVWSEIFEKLKSTPETILTCREVCIAFKNEVDRKILSWAEPTELDPLTIDGMPVRKLWTKNIYSRQSMGEFKKEIENLGRNLLSTGMLSFHPKSCTRCCTTFCNKCLSEFENVYARFFQFTKRFGPYVHDLGFTMVNRSSMEQLKRSVFHNFPNVRQLEIKVVKSTTSWRPKRKFNWLHDFNFPPLVHLTNLKLIFGNVDGEMLITQILKAYGSQIKTFTVMIFWRTDYTPTFGNFSSDILPNLANLKIRFVPPHHDLLQAPKNHVLNFLINGHWPLKQLSLYEWHNGIPITFKLSELMDIISKFASTLKVLHLYFSNYTDSFRRLEQLSLPDKFTPKEVANELQLGVEFPLVEEFSLPYGCFKYGTLATSKLCQKFVNLKTIHMCDDKLKKANYITPNHEEELSANWWPILSPLSKLERVIIFSGNEFDQNVVVHKVIQKPGI